VEFVDQQLWNSTAVVRKIIGLARSTRPSEASPIASQYSFQKPTTICSSPSQEIDFAVWDIKKSKANFARSL
jgi:hypothetical protein